MKIFAKVIKMTRDQITEILLQRADALKAIGATSLYMFGSRARGDNRPDSDLDLFIDYNANEKIPLASRLIAFESELKRDTGLAVEIATRDDFHKYIRVRIENDAVRVF
jgi:uncharacterized protein